MLKAQDYNLYNTPIAQSDDPIPQTTMDTSVEQEQNVVFKDDEVEKVLGYGFNFHDSTFDNADQENSSLGDFLSRPVEIYTALWEVGTTFSARRLFAWERYLTNPRIREKLNTYKLLNGTLNVKIMINGSPFHYGRLFVGLRPTRNTNNTYNNGPNDNIPTFNYKSGGAEISFPAQAVFYSQRPHIFLNPAKNIPQHIQMPFFSSVDWIDVTDTDDYRRLGVLEMWELTRLRHANDADETVRISLYAWMSDVKLTGITTTLPDAQADNPQKKGGRKNGGNSGKKNNNQSQNQNQNDNKNKKAKASQAQGKGSDEFDGDGVVSYPASVIESIASKLTTVPFIGKWAKATSIGAGAVKNIASIFGFSNPAILDKQCMLNQTQLGRMCQTAGNDPLVKLSLDPKNELTIDPSTVGLDGADEMSFIHIAKREAFVFRAGWSTTAGIDPGEGHLAGWRVSPFMGPASDEGENPSFKWLAPVGHVAAPFQYWTGSLVYRIQVVCSQFHRGRLAVVYTPDIGANMGPEWNASEHYSYIIDIMQETDISFEVRWAQPATWAEVVTDSTETTDLALGSNTALGTDRFNNNGRMDIYVVTDLGAPVSPSSVDINVFLSAGDSFRVAAPGDRLSKYSFSFMGGTYDLPDAESGFSYYLPHAQSGAYYEQPTEDKPNQNDNAVVINGSTVADNSEMLHVYMGEDIRSVRALIKRYNPYNIYPKIVHDSDIGSGDTMLSSIEAPIFPIGRSFGTAYGSSGVDQFGIAANVFMTYLRWFGQAYIGFRGSVRYKYIFVGNNIDAYDMSVSRSTKFTKNIYEFQVRIPLNDSAKEQHDVMMGEGIESTTYLGDTAGVIVQPNRNSNSISYELPWYHPTRFGDLHEVTQETDDRYNYYNAINQRHDVKLSVTYPAQGFGVNAKSFVAGGEDASFFFYIGCPPFIVIQPGQFA